MNLEGLPDRLWSLWSSVRAWVRSSPGTHIYLLIIGITSLVIASASEGLETFLLHRTSSNIHELDKHPLQSLLISGFWMADPSSFLFYAVLFEVFHANVERWIGTLRWLCAVAVAHVAATLVSQQILLLAIESHSAPRSMKHVVDIGVSYGLAGAVGILTYRMPRPWRWLYLTGAVLFFAVPLTTGGTFTDAGHAIALALGLALWPLTRGRPTWRWDLGRAAHRRTRAPGDAEAVGTADVLGPSEVTADALGPEAALTRTDAREPRRSRRPRAKR
ncbi:rhomboid-like protein [Streptomyces triculaminicus]|uniref:rhomboid-like protein n=1 Tax=Streptomyces triculaminicus TaxID=2816232 RepID=UPI003F4CCA8E